MRFCRAEAANVRNWFLPLSRLLPKAAEYAGECEGGVAAATTSLKSINWFAEGAISPGKPSSEEESLLLGLRQLGIAVRVQGCRGGGGGIVAPDVRRPRTGGPGSASVNEAIACFFEVGFLLEPSRTLFACRATREQTRHTWCTVMVRRPIPACFARTSRHF